MSATSSPPQLISHQQEQKSRRRKCVRACINCQKAHLTCDDSRPCQRCVRRELASTCTDGLRKKAKYLQGTDEVQDSNTSSTLPVNSLSIPPEFALPLQILNEKPTHTHPLITNLNLDPTSLLGIPATAEGFGSQAVNLEYSILSSMLTSPDARTIAGAIASVLSGRQSWAPASNTSVSGATSTAEGSVAASVAPVAFSQRRDSKRKLQDPESVYNGVKTPHNYVEGYHYLIKYVEEKMDKESLMRITRAISAFRPSFITLIMNLTGEDLIFMEKMFQRMLLEFEKLLSFSGTPTVVWRRTGQITLVGKEFCLLTQWTKEQLLGKKYIYELMDHQSAVEYWEKFALHAFDAESSIMTTCVLLSPAGRRVPCGFCFTIKRDIFNIPLTIVGNFLPILI
ncbi:uncharacterized protein VTP21DRAFT_5160 [Calcarisporiella thermophila]|uniref:uncharacterized protein n=1 Tax=Calcarisporiella thermophila TaxID=911321 RepID=UPI0037437302